MAFIFIPLVLILISLLGIFLIMWRKTPYLKKLAVEDTQSDSSIWIDFFPELKNWINSSQIKRYREIWLIELEKFLRRLRVMSLKMDRTSGSLIGKIRNRIEKKQNKKDDLFIAGTEESFLTKKNTHFLVDPKINEPIKETAEDFKREEQKLIIEIAKNPKNSSFYESLGDLYVKMLNFNDAKESYEAAIELNSGDEEIKNKLSMVLENLSKK